MAGWILCDGRAVSVADYPELYAIIGNKFGGNGITFNVPNLKDKFLQGANGNLGQEKQAGLPNIKGSFQIQQYIGHTSATNGVFKLGNLWATQGGHGYNEWQWFSGSFDASRSNTIYGKSSTVQPPAITINFFIKAKADKE